MNERVKQVKHLFKLNAKVLCLFKTLKQNESHAIVKVHCVAFKLSNDNNETEDEKNSSDSSNLDFLLKSMSLASLLILNPSLKLL
jgi:hypothetical protein